MQPTRIIPDLQCALVCEDIRQEVTGNLIFLGVINFIRVPQLPIAVFKLCMVTRWTAGMGQFAEGIRLISPDQTTVLWKSDVKFALRDPSTNCTNVSVMSQVKLEAAGVYYVEVLVDDVMKLRVPLPVAVVPPPQQGQEATATQ
jgi:hypothetical protein